MNKKVELNSLYWIEGKKYFGRNLKSFKEATILKLIDIPNGQIAILDNGKSINTKFLTLK